MKKYLLVGLAICLMVVSLKAQSGYKSGVGARVGSGNYDLISFSYKTFIIADKGALEINFGGKPDNSDYISNYNLNIFNLSFSTSYQHHLPIGNIQGFNWFVGGGVTAYNSFSNTKAYRGVGVGIFPTTGAEYKFNNFPLSVSADFRPTFSIVNPYDVNPYNSFYVSNVGIGIRYTYR